MKFVAFVVSAATLAIPTLGQTSGDGFPDCATKAGSALLQGADCALGDLKCTCASDAFIQNVVTMIPQVCNSEDTATVENTLKNICASAGVTVTFPDPAGESSTSVAEQSTSSSVPAPASTTGTGAEGTTPSAVASETTSASGAASSGSVSETSAASSPTGPGVSGIASPFASFTKTPAASASLPGPQPSYVTAGANSQQVDILLKSLIVGLGLAIVV